MSQQFEIVTFPPKVVSTYVHTCELIQYYKPDSPSSKIVSCSAWLLYTFPLMEFIAVRRGTVPQSTLLNIYNSLVQSHFDYCSLVWGNCGKTLSNKLRKLQNRAARVILHQTMPVDVYFLSQTHQLEIFEISTSNSEHLNGFQVFKRSGSRISHV